MKKSFWRKYIGDKAFYKMVLMIVIPVIIQNGITNFVNLLDNIMGCHCKSVYERI